MNKGKIIKISSTIGLVAAVGYRVYSAIKSAKQEQEVIDITPDDENKKELKGE